MDIKQLTEKASEAKKTLDYLRNLGAPTEEACFKFLSKEVEPLIAELIKPVIEALGEDVICTFRRRMLCENTQAILEANCKKDNRHKRYLQITFADGTVYNNAEAGSSIKTTFLDAVKHIGVDGIRNIVPYFIIDELQYSSTNDYAQEKLCIAIPGTSLYVNTGTTQIWQAKRNFENVLKAMNLQDSVKVELIDY